MSQKLELGSVCNQIIDNNVGVCRARGHLSIVVKEFYACDTWPVEGKLVHLLQLFSFKFQTIDKDSAWAKANGNIVWSGWKACDMTIECLFVIDFELNLSSFDISEVNNFIASGH